MTVGVRQNVLSISGLSASAKVCGSLCCSQLLTSTIQFLPGQWLDVHIPGLRQVGGFTITSTPHDLETFQCLELAVQLSPRNPPAAWFWQEKHDIVGKQLAIGVGGSFVWPPPHVDVSTVDKVVLVAGGVGIK